VDHKVVAAKVAAKLAVKAEAVERAAPEMGEITQAQPVSLPAGTEETVLRNRNY